MRDTTIVARPAGPGNGGDAAALRELAGRLHAEGAGPDAICRQLLAADRRPLGEVPTVAALVRELPGLAGWNALDAWQARLAGEDQADLAAGIYPEMDPPGLESDDRPPLLTPAEVLRRKAGERLGRWVLSRGEFLAPALVLVLRDAIVALVR